MKKNYEWRKCDDDKPMARRNEVAGNRGKSDSRNREVTEMRIPRKSERTGEAISGRHNEIADTIEKHIICRN